MAIKQTTMKTAKEWIASVKDPVIKRYLERVSPRIVGYEPTYNNFVDFICEYFTWDKSNQGKKFWLAICDFLINNKIGSPSTLSYSDFKHLDESVETQLKEDKETPKMDKLQHPTAFRKEWMKNNAHVVNTEHHELLLMKAYALYYHDYKTRSVEQPKVSVNEDHRCTNYDPFGNCNCQEVSVNEDAVEFKKEQILDAYRKGFSEGVCFGVSPTGYNHISAEEYFNKTFKNE